MLLCASSKCWLGASAYMLKIIEQSLLLATQPAIVLVNSSQSQYELTFYHMSLSVPVISTRTSNVVSTWGKKGSPLPLGCKCSKLRSLGWAERVATATHCSQVPCVMD